MYNLYNFEADFYKYLQGKRLSSNTLRNYLSDFRHFWSWFLLTLKHDNFRNISEHDPQILTYITSPLLKQYKKFLILNSVAPLTINRRLTVVRQFAKYCMLENWMKKDLSSSITNVSVPKKTITISKEEIVAKFAQHLEKDELSTITKRNYLGDIRQFLSWMEDVVLDSSI